MADDGQRAASPTWLAVDDKGHATSLTHLPTVGPSRAGHGQQQPGGTEIWGVRARVQEIENGEGYEH
jgi:hypothetical protein